MDINNHNLVIIILFCFIILSLIRILVISQGVWKIQAGVD